MSAQRRRGEMEKTMREAKLERNTNETQIELEINLDGTGKAEIQTGIGFFDHMLTLLAFHSEMDIKKFSCL